MNGKDKPSEGATGKTARVAILTNRLRVGDHYYAAGPRPGMWNSFP